MSTCNIQVPTNNSVFAVDAREGPFKYYTLPAASTMSGRYLSFKDYFGLAGSSTFYLSTNGLDRVDIYNSTITISTSFQSMSFMSDGTLNWTTLANQTGPVPLTFEPTQISTPEIWFDASQLSSIDYDTANCNVTTWSNLGSIQVFAESYGSLNPPKVFQRTQNGLNLMSYGFSNSLRITSMSFGSSERTLFSVLRLRDPIGTGKGITFLTANNGYNFLDFSFILNYDSGTRSNLWGTVNGGYCFPIYGLISNEGETFYLVSGRATFSDSGQQGVWLNGTEISRVFYCASESSGTAYPYYVGGGVLGECPAYELAEFMIFQYLLTNDERQRTEGYLAWKWGLRHLLPADHPYKNASP
jgi:hypothetical protein